ncbi:general substrate transporter [Elsinoe ampelina]|uniref:General substrate transporter n=1 Tax=Elsinoe ampelina TaxID=302913 RepID=A0A6A6GEF8_9PEZI|nr:general substrate transporter [Elsinoe ampelina]
MATLEEKTETSHVEDTDDPIKQNDTLTVGAREAALEEHSMTIKQALKKYPKAVFWSIMVSTAIIMEGYDIVLVGSLFAQPDFQRRYGQFYGDDIGYQISGPWQAGLSCGATVGTIVGAFGNGWLTHKYGYRKVLLVSLVSMTGFIFLTFFANSITMLLVGQILCGVPWGVFATLAPAYASEVCPLALRGYLTVYVNICWAFGQLLAAGVLAGTEGLGSQWAYRIPFAVQWVWPPFLLAVLVSAPESPWWLVRAGRIEDAKKVIMRLTTGLSIQDATKSVAQMVHTTRLEESLSSGTSYLDLFRGDELRRTEVVCVVFAAQVFSGSNLGGAPTYFFTQAGLPSSTSFQFSVGGLGLACIGTIVSWFLLSVLGRRTIYVIGLGALAAIMFTIGFIQVGTSSEGGSWAMGSMVLVWLLVYYLTVGPICYAIISETSSVQLRSKSVCVARISYYIAQIIGYVVQPYMINPTEGNLKGKAGFVWGATGLICFAWAFFRLPETKDRTFEELDILFARKVPARQFKGYHVDAYEDEVDDVIQG